MTQVGYVNISSILDKGVKVSGYLDLSPKIKFYSGFLFKSPTKKIINIIRQKAKQINCVPGFTDRASGKKFHLTSISGSDIKAVSIDSENDISIQSFELNKVDSILNWEIR